MSEPKASASREAYENVDVEATMKKLVEKLGPATEPRIAAKIAELQGIVSHTGALALVCRECAVEIVWKRKPLDLSTLRRIQLRDLTPDLVKKAVEVHVVITKASELKVSQNNRNYQFFTLEDGTRALDVIVFGKQCGMFASWMGRRVVVKPLSVAKYQDTLQLRVVDETQVYPDEQPAPPGPQSLSVPQATAIQGTLLS